MKRYDELYDELMEKIEVTDEMRTRILHHVDRELSAAEHTSGSAPLLKVRRRMKRYLSAAACLAVVLIGALALPQLMRPNRTRLSHWNRRYRLRLNLRTCRRRHLLCLHPRGRPRAYYPRPPISRPPRRARAS